MIETFRDGAWQAIGALLTGAAILVSVLVYRWQRQRKVLTYRILSSYPLLKNTEELQGRLSVLVDKRPVRNIEVMFVEVQNSGNCSITAADFYSPISFAFESPSEIISAVVESETPANLGVTLDTNETSVSVVPTLLNPNDRFSIKLLLSSESSKFTVRGRVVGVNEISHYRPRLSNAWLALLGLALIAIGIMFAVFSAPPRRPDNPPIPVQTWYGIAVAFAGYILTAYAALRNRRLVLFIGHHASKWIR